MEKLLFSTLGLIFGALLTIFGNEVKRKEI